MVVVEVLSCVVVHVRKGHPVAKERIPPDREVHPAPERLVGLSIELPMQRGDDAACVSVQSRPVKHKGATAGTEVVDDVEARSGGVQNPCEHSAG